jgi:uncharacterized RDD family membrane protein YckC
VQYEERTRIATPEGIELELVLAGLASRFMAEIVDAALIVLLVLALIAVAAIAGGTAGLVIVSIAVGGLMLISVCFHVAFEVLAAGRTPGKRMNGLRVVMDGGGPVGLRASAVRNLLRLLEGPPLLYVPAVVSILATRRNQRLGDLAAGTVVARATQEGGPAFRRLPPGEYADWDVSAVTQQELAAVRSFLGRRFDFEPAVRYQLAFTLARKLGPKVSGAPPYDQQPERFLEQLESAKSARL